MRELRRSALIAHYLERQTSPINRLVISNFPVIIHGHIKEAHIKNLFVYVYAYIKIYVYTNMHKTLYM